MTKPKKALKETAPREQDLAISAPITASEISRVMTALGQQGEKIGGGERADSKTKRRRSENALTAARSRWETQRIG